ncbi:MAG: 3-keto-5-aminohexanoate cleavage protein [Pseudomonadota bacterium]
MGKPCIICVAITGSVPTKADNPAVPITVEEQVASTRAAYEAGAAIVHCHVRDDAGLPTSDPERFGALKAGIEAACPGIIVQLSTGGRSGAGRARGAMLPLRPDMASLTVGSNNFPTRVYENPPDLVDWLAGEMKAHDVMPEIEAFDLSHLHHAALMVRDGRLAPRPYVQFVMGVKNAMPADKETFDFFVRTVERLIPGVEWCGAGIARHQIEMNDWCAAAGGHLRTGLEDNLRLDRATLAPSNAVLVARAAEVAARYGRPVATPAEARRILGLRPAA